MLRFMAGCVLGVLVAVVLMNLPKQEGLLWGVAIGTLGTIACTLLFLSEIAKFRNTSTTEEDDKDHKDRWWSRGETPPWE